jgi:hypothetical protein
VGSCGTWKRRYNPEIGYTEPRWWECRRSFALESQPSNTHTYRHSHSNHYSDPHDHAHPYAIPDAHTIPDPHPFANANAITNRDSDAFAYQHSRIVDLFTKPGFYTSF